MLKSFFKDSFIYSINTFLSKGISFLLIPLYTSKLVPADYGIIDIFTVLTSFLNVTIALEISQAVARYFPSIRNPLKKKVYASSAMWFTVSAYTLFAFLFLAVPNFFNQLITFGEASIDIFILATINIFLTGVFYFFQEQLRWTNKTVHYSIVSIFYTIVTFSSCAFLIVIEEHKVTGYFIGMIIGNLCGISISFYLNKKAYGFNFYFKAVKIMLRFSIPLIFSSISVILTMYADRILINYFLSLKELGLFGIAFRFASVTGLLMTGIQGALIPLVYRHYNQINTPKHISEIFNLFVLFSVILLSLLVLFSKELVLWLTHPNYYSAWTLIPIISLSNIFAIIYIFTPGLSIAKKTSYLAYINIGGAILNVGLNYFLITTMGLHGSVFATLISYISVFAVNVIVSQQYYYIPFNTPLLCLVIGIFITLCSVFVLLEILYSQFQLASNLNLILFKFGLMLLEILILMQIPEYKDKMKSGLKNLKKFYYKRVL